MSEGILYSCWMTNCSHTTQTLCWTKFYSKRARSCSVPLNKNSTELNKVLQTVVNYEDCQCRVVSFLLSFNLLTGWSTSLGKNTPELLLQAAEFLVYLFTQLSYGEKWNCVVFKPNTGEADVNSLGYFSWRCLLQVKVMWYWMDMMKCIINRSILIWQLIGLAFEFLVFFRCGTAKLLLKYQKIALTMSSLFEIRNAF